MLWHHKLTPPPALFPLSLSLQLIEALGRKVDHRWLRAHCGGSGIVSYAQFRAFIREHPAPQLKSAAELEEVWRALVSFDPSLGAFGAGEDEGAEESSIDASRLRFLLGRYGASSRAVAERDIEMLLESLGGADGKVAKRDVLALLQRAAAHGVCVDEALSVTTSRRRSRRSGSSSSSASSSRSSSTAMSPAETLRVDGSEASFDTTACSGSSGSATSSPSLDSAASSRRSSGGSFTHDNPRDALSPFEYDDSCSSSLDSLSDANSAASDVDGDSCGEDDTIDAAVRWRDGGGGARAVAPAAAPRPRTSRYRYC